MNTSAGPGFLGLTEYAVLGALSLRPAHGYDVFRLLDENLRSVCRFHRSQTYSVLKRLEQEGLVTHEKIEQARLPTKKVFRLSATGAEAFNAWAQSPVAHIRDLRVEFLVKLFFVGMGDKDIRQELLADQLAVCRRKLERLKNLEHAARQPLEKQVLAFRVHFIRATILWLSDLLKNSELSPAPAAHAVSYQFVSFQVTLK